MISIMEPGDSWVAKYNHGQKRSPGVYAIHVFSDGDAVRSGSMNSEDEEDDGFPH